MNLEIHTLIYMCIKFCLSTYVHMYIYILTYALLSGEQKEKKAQLQLIDDLKTEVVSTKEEYGKRLRSLRQEHERYGDVYMRVIFCNLFLLLCFD